MNSSQSSSHVPHCPTCGSEKAAGLGTASNALEDHDTSLAQFSSSLYRCMSCDLVYRFPTLSPERLDAIYKAMPITEWTYEHRPYWDWTRDAIRKYAPNNRVLDIGCFRGDFLHSLGDAFDRFGIEPNREAAAAASQRGIQVIGQFATDDLGEYRGTFGAVVMMDVIEHVHDPRRVLEKVLEALAPGGILILLTGDSRAWPARISLPFYWYMAMPIHLVYLSDPYVQWLEKALGLRRLEWRTLAHQERGLLRRWRHNVGCGATALWQKALRKRPLTRWIGNIPPFRTVRNYSAPPFLMSLKDHFWTVLATDAAAKSK